MTPYTPTQRKIRKVGKKLEQVFLMLEDNRAKQSYKTKQLLSNDLRYYERIVLENEVKNLNGDILLLERKQMILEKEIKDLEKLEQ